MGILFMNYTSSGGSGLFIDTCRTTAELANS